MSDLFRPKYSRTTLLDLYEELAYYFSLGDSVQTVWDNFQERGVLRKTRQAAARLSKLTGDGVPLGSAIHDTFRLKTTLAKYLLDQAESPQSLSQSFDLLSALETRAQDFRLQLKDLLWSTFIPLTIVFVITMVILIYVIPQFEAIFSNFGADLPELTRVVIDVARLPFAEFVLTLIAIVIVWPFLARRIPWFQEQLDFVEVRLPWFGGFRSQIILDEYMFTLTRLHSFHPSGQDEKTLLLARQTVENTYLRRALEEESAGLGVYDSILQSQLLPIKVKRLVRDRPEIDVLESRAEDYFDRNAVYLTDRSQRLSQLISGTARFAFVIVVGVLVLAMYMPIFRIASVL